MISTSPPLVPSITPFTVHCWLWSLSPLLEVAQLHLGSSNRFPPDSGLSKGMPPSSTVVTLVWLLSTFEWSSCRCGGSMTFIRTCRFLILILTCVLSICNTSNSCVSLLWFGSSKGRGLDNCRKLVIFCFKSLIPPSSEVATADFIFKELDFTLVNISHSASNISFKSSS